MLTRLWLSSLTTTLKQLLVSYAHRWSSPARGVQTPMVAIFFFFKHLVLLLLGPADEVAVHRRKSWRLRGLVM